MKKEVEAGVGFLVRLLKARGKADEQKVDCFGKKLTSILFRRYTNHWYPTNPSKGQAFRSILISSSQQCDELVLQAFQESDLNPSELGLPRELILWIDPFEVCARSGERSRSFTVAQFKETDDEEILSEPDSQEETSDYHSAGSSDYNSETSSENEGEKESQKEDGVLASASENLTPVIKTLPSRKKKHKQPQVASLQYFYHPAPVWQQFGGKGSLCSATVYQPRTPMVYYCIPPTTQTLKLAPQFIVPQVALQPCGMKKC
ncbi:maternal B9.15 protein [Erpetoichthys calabaricus]|uniref:Si:dkey-79d12.5 n=1 Tax=Erpetoichthys calabaricus TaxID=27687 RepID=A0A8C4XE77_ERPCA|nr:maternal B9.15 protein [Erpetoichthys calabaricus]XP_051776465.1 maternal B9.15 protein [Erpetoichthys calabaricus]